MSNFLFRKPPKVILDDKTLEEKKRIKINPSEVEETEEIFDNVPNYMKSTPEEEENWRQYNHRDIDGLLKNNL